LLNANQAQKGAHAMTHDDVLFGYRLRLFTLAEELGSVSEAGRKMGRRRPRRSTRRYGRV